MELLTKGEYAYRRLHEDILSGKLPAGSRLVIKDLAEEYQVSSLPVRNAVTRLEELGLVHTSAHQGAWVAEMNLENYFTFMLIRTDMEALAARLAANNREESLLEELEQFQVRMEAASATGDSETYGRLNRQIHTRICEASGNQTLVEQINILMKRTQLAVGLFHIVSRQKSCQEHRDLIKALRDRDSDRSAAIIRFQRSRANLEVIHALLDDVSEVECNQLLKQSVATPEGRRCLEQLLPIFEQNKTNNDYHQFAAK